MSDNHCITVISYNIRWESMDNITTRKNIIQNITNAISEYKPDIIGLQEANKWQKILKHVNFKKYNVAHNTSGVESMITMWNRNRFDKIYVNASEFEEGRPFIIMYLKDKTNNNILCVINVHSSHNTNTQKHIFDIINNKLKKINIYFNRIIILGDFNRNVTIDTKSNYIIKNKNKNFKMKSFYLEKKTCCSMLGYGHKFNYDHVMDSLKPIDKIVVNDKWYNKISSDHIMIVSKLA